MSRTRVRRRRVTLVAAATMLAGLVVGPIGHAFEAGASDRHARTVTVRSGDTLWAIAERTRPGEDPRATIEIITTVNGVDAGDLLPGQRLVVPAP